MSEEKLKLVKFLSDLTQVEIYHQLESGSKISCGLVSRIIYAIIEIGNGLEAPGIALNFSRYHSSEYSFNEIAENMMAIIEASLSKWEKEQHS